MSTNIVAHQRVWSPVNPSALDPHRLGYTLAGLSNNTNKPEVSGLQSSEAIPFESVKCVNRKCPTSLQMETCTCSPPVNSFPNQFAFNYRFLLNAKIYPTILHRNDQSRLHQNPAAKLCCGLMELSRFQLPSTVSVVCRKKRHYCRSGLFWTLFGFVRLVVWWPVSVGGLDFEYACLPCIHTGGLNRNPYHDPKALLQKPMVLMTHFFAAHDSYSDRKTHFPSRYLSRISHAKVSIKSTSL